MFLLQRHISSTITPAFFRQIQLQSKHRIGPHNTTILPNARLILGSHEYPHYFKGLDIYVLYSMQILVLISSLCFLSVVAVKPKPRCKGPLPLTGWPKNAGSFPWSRYLSLQELCTDVQTAYRGSASKFAPYSLDCHCPLYPATFLLCEVPSIWKPAGWDLVQYCEDRCRCPGDIRPFPPDPPPIPLIKPQIPLRVRRPKRRRRQSPIQLMPSFLQEQACHQAEDLDSLLYCHEHGLD